MLVEALVALVVAGFFLSVLGRAMAGAWGSVKAPMDMVSGIALARSAALGATAEAFDLAAARGFTIDRTRGPIEIVHRASRLAPALVDNPQPEAASATPPGMRLAEPKGVGKGAPNASTAKLERVSVTVATPLGRHLRLDTIQIDHDAR